MSKKDEAYEYWKAKGLGSGAKLDSDEELNEEFDESSKDQANEPSEYSDADFTLSVSLK